MPGHYNLREEFEKTKTQLNKFSQQISKMAKKGEAEFVKLSRRSKLHMDSTTLTLKKEHLYYLIGREYSKLKDKSIPSAALKEFLSELESTDKEQRALQKKLKEAPKN